MPVLHPAELWQQSGRWYDIKDEMFRLKDRHGRDMCLGMTHEEVVAWLASKEIRSYRELPQVWYQIQTKERDEARPRSGVLRTREFWMKDAYTLDADDAGLDVAYERQKEAYNRIFRRCRARVPRRRVRRRDDGRRRRARVHGAERGRRGRDRALPGVRLRRQRRAGAVAVPGDAAFPTGPADEVATPGVRTIAEVCQLLGIEPAHDDQEPALRGAVRAGARAGPRRPAAPREEARAAPGRRGARGAPRRGAGRARRAGRVRGPGGRRGADRGGRGAGARGCTWPAPTARASTCGASGRAGTSPPGTPTSTWPRPGTPAPRAARRSSSSASSRSGTSSSSGRGTRRRWGRRTSTSRGRRGRSSWGRTGSARPGSSRRRSSSVTTRTASCGPGRSRPCRSTSFPSTPSSRPVREMAERLYRDLGAAGFEAILDDRDERPGVKFKDADLLGIPIRVTVGALLGREGQGRGANAAGSPGCRGRAGRRGGGRPGPRREAGRRPLALSQGSRGSSALHIGVY